MSSSMSLPPLPPPPPPPPPPAAADSVPDSVPPDPHPPVPLSPSQRRKATQQQKYALVSTSSSSSSNQQQQSHNINNNNNVLQLLSDIRREFNNNNNNNNRQSSASTTMMITQKIYENYAELYPNPQLVQEYLERDRLLNIIWDEQQQQQQQQKQQKQQQQGKIISKNNKNKKTHTASAGFFSFLFGTKTNTNTNRNTNEFHDHHDVEKDAIKYLSYTDIIRQNNNNNNNTISLTNHGLDTDCIPQEAHSVARLYHQNHYYDNYQPYDQHQSTSTNNNTNANTNTNMIACVVNPILPRTLHKDNNNNNNNNNNNAQSSAPCSSSFVILDLGIIAEFSNNNNNNNDHSRIVTTTNDIHLLREQLSHDSNSSYTPSLIRATQISDSILAISWGFQDGLVILYGKLNNKHNKNKKSTSTASTGWQSIAMLTPERAVLEHIQSDGEAVFLQNDTDNTISSQLLRVSALQSVVLYGMPVLLITRLGGYAALVPLPNTVWSQIPPPEQMPKYATKKKRNNKLAIVHYANGILFNLSSEEEQLGTVALTMLEHHKDIMASTIQPLNETQCLLAVTGMKQTKTTTTQNQNDEFDFSDDGEITTTTENNNAAAAAPSEQNLSLWIVSLANKPVHVEFFDVLPLPSTIGGLSLFASPTIIEQWRFPRHVSRKEQSTQSLSQSQQINNNEDGNDDSGNDDDDEHTTTTTTTNTETSLTNRPASLSIPAPVVKLCFLPGSQSLRLAVLDSNGGVSVFLCQLQNHGTEQQQSVCSLQWSRSDLLRKIGSSNTNSTSSCRRRRRRSLKGFDTAVVDVASTNEGELLVTTKHKTVCVISQQQSDDSNTSNCVVVQMALPPKSGLVRFLGPLHQLVFPYYSNKNKASLHLCRVQPLMDSSHMIRRLIDLGKYQEAIDAAAAATQEGTGGTNLEHLVEECHVRLWESAITNNEQRQPPQNEDENENENDCVVSHLESITNSEYVVKQVLELLSGTNHHMNLLPIETGRRACQIGIQRLDTLRVASALQMLPKDKDEMKEELRTTQISMGTFQLLARHLENKKNSSNDNDNQDSKTLLRDYFESPLHNAGEASSVFKSLALSLAVRGDIIGLTIVLWRHTAILLPHRMEIVDKIPITVDPMKFAHLLPSIMTPTADGANFNGAATGTSFLVTHESNASFYDWAKEMVWFVQDFQGNGTLVLDETDKTFVIEACSSTPILKNGDDNDALAPFLVNEQTLVGWFEKRCSLLQSMVGTLSYVASFCQLATKCLEGSEAPHTRESIAQFHSVRKCAQCLDELLLAGASSDEALLFASVNDLRQKPLEDIVSILLGVPSDAHEIPTRFRTNVLPIVSSLPSNTCSEEHIDSALSEYCSRLLRGTQIDKDRSYETAKNIRKNLAICAAIASASRSSLRKSDRMIKSRQTLVEMVLTTKDEVASLCDNDLDFLAIDAKSIVDLLWDAYESLPSQPTPEDDETMVDLDEKANSFYRQLVSTEILAQWAPSTALSNLKDNNFKADQIAKLLCEAFCTQTKKGNRNENVDDGRTQLLSQFISDLQLINEVTAESKLNLPSTLQEELLPSLLETGQFHTFADLLETEIGCLIDFDEIQVLVVRFLDDSMSQDDLQLAMDCQDILGSRFPEIGHRFDHVRKYLDAAQFINPIGRFSFTPAMFKDMLPLDVIATVLKENPRCILHDCDLWLESDYARTKNMGMIERLTHEQSWKALPIAELPGGAVLHLASILFFDGSPIPSSHLFVVRALLFETAIQMQLPWVAATFAIQNVYFHEKDIQEALESVRFDMVANLVKHPKYDDILVKKALCTTVLKKWNGNIRESESSSINVIMEVLQELELKTSRFDPDAWSLGNMYGSGGGLHRKEKATDQSEFPAFGQVAGALANGVKSFTRSLEQSGGQDEDVTKKTSLIPKFRARAIDRVFRDTLSGYSANLGNLFSILRVKASKCESDDPLLQALNRLTMFWCIANAVKIINTEPRVLSVDSCDALEVLALTTSILLHARNIKCINENATELLQILESQSHEAMRKSSTSSKPQVLKPDLHIVKELVNRGFSENGARRAAVMTGNKSVDVALVWAVGNSDERNFNEPIVLVKNFSEQYLNQRMMHDISECLVLLRLHANGQKTLDSFIPSRIRKVLEDLCPSNLPGMTTISKGRVLPKAGLSVKKPVKAEVTPLQQNGQTSFSTKPSQHKKSAQPNNPLQPPPNRRVPTQNSKLMVPPKHVVESSTSSLKPSIKAKHLVIETPTKSHPPPANENNVTPSNSVARPPLPPSVSTKQIKTTPKIPTTRASGSSIPVLTINSKPSPPPPPPPPPAPRSGPTPSVSVSPPKTPRTPISQPLDRASLRKSGQLSRRSGMGSNLSPEERARLIQKGRRLLEKARGSPPKPTAPPRPLPNLLSRPTTSSPQNGDDKNSSKAKTTTKEDTEGWDFDDF